MTCILNLDWAQLRLLRVGCHVMYTLALKHFPMVGEKLRLGGSMDQHVVDVQLTDTVKKSCYGHATLTIRASSF